MPPVRICPISSYNGGVGTAASGTAGIAFTVDLTPPSKNTNSYVVNIRPNDSCNASLSVCGCEYTTTELSLELVIGSDCRNAIATVESLGPSMPKLESYQVQPYPGTVPPSMMDNPPPLTAKIVNLTCCRPVHQFHDP
jgi:hypothetical protein